MKISSPAKIGEQEVKMEIKDEVTVMNLEDHHSYITARVIKEIAETGKVREKLEEFYRRDDVEIVENNGVGGERWKTVSHLRGTSDSRGYCEVRYSKYFDTPNNSIVESVYVDGKKVLEMESKAI